MLYYKMASRHGISMELKWNICGAWNDPKEWMDEWMNEWMDVQMEGMNEGISNEIKKNQRDEIKWCMNCNGQWCWGWVKDDYELRLEHGSVNRNQINMMSQQ